MYDWEGEGEVGRWEKCGGEGRVKCHWSDRLIRNSVLTRIKAYLGVLRRIKM